MAKLKLGIIYQGKLYKDFNVHLLTIGGECNAHEMIAERGLEGKQELSKRVERLVDMAYLSQQFSVDGIPNTELTPKFLFDNLATDDYWQIISEQLELRKKLSADGESLNPAAEES